MSQRLAAPSRTSGATPTYVYAVRSRRTGGLSLGVNLTPNNACNFRCVYCDVVDLVQSDGPELDLALLESELTEAFEALSDPAWLESASLTGAHAELRSLCISGRGEPTIQFDFPKAIETIAKVAKGRAPRFALLTNGAELTAKKTRAGLATWAELGGEIWFKVDTATREGAREINGSGMLLRLMRNALRVSTESCPTWIQTTLFNRDGQPMSDTERSTYLGFLSDQLRSGLKLQGIQLCTADRPSAQTTGIEPASPEFVEALATDIRALGLTCEV